MDSVTSKAIGPPPWAWLIWNCVPRMPAMPRGVWIFRSESFFSFGVPMIRVPKSSSSSRLDRLGSSCSSFIFLPSGVKASCSNFLTWRVAFGSSVLIVPFENSRMTCPSAFVSIELPTGMRSFFSVASTGSGSPSLSLKRIVPCLSTILTPPVPAFACPHPSNGVASQPAKARTKHLYKIGFIPRSPLPLRPRGRAIACPRTGRGTRCCRLFP